MVRTPFQKRSASALSKAIDSFTDFLSSETMKTWQLLVACGYACALARGTMAAPAEDESVAAAVVREPEESDQYIVADESAQQQQLEAFETEFVPEPDPEVVAAQRAAYCLARGFDPETLHCSLCEKMAAFMQPKKDQVVTEIAAEADDEKKQPLQLKLDAFTDITEGCSDCCSETAVSKEEDASGDSESTVVEEVELYERVVLEVCTCKFNRYPKIKNFVNNHAKDHKRLEIKV